MSNIIEPRLVTAIIPVFNRPLMMREAVASILAQDYRPIEVILVNDGSTDGTAEILKLLAEQHQEVRIMEQPNAGPGAARQLGMEHARGEFVQFLDSDDMLLPNKFSQQVAALQQRSDCMVAYGRTRLLVDGLPHGEGAWKRTGEKHETMFPSFLNERWWGTSTPLYRRTVLDQVGAWSSLSNEEDWEYDCRIAALGGKLVFVDEDVSIQRRHDANLSAGGTIDPAKLRDRCVARTLIYRSALISVIPIPSGEMQHFSKSVFLLARECAAASLDREAEQMLGLSIEILGGANFKQRLFAVAGNAMGWRTAARIVSAMRR